MDTLWQMSLTAGYVCLVICLLRLALKKAPKIYSYALWAVVFLRLICPVALSSPVSLLPRWETVEWQAQQEQKEWQAQQDQQEQQGGDVIGEEDSLYAGGKTEGDRNTAPVVSDSIYEEAEGGDLNYDQEYIQQGPPIQTGTVLEPTPIVPSEDVTEIDPVVTISDETYLFVAVLWLLGAAGILLYQGEKSRRWKMTFGAVEQVEEEIYTAEYIEAPFVMGLWEPKIYLPCHMSEQERKYVVLHERMHLRRKDYAVKLAAFVITCVHWFNPFAWLAYRLMCMDMEMSCDEAVLKQMKKMEKKEYATALLAFASHTVDGGSLAFGEPYAKKRIRNVLRFRRPTFRLTLVLTVVCLFLASCLLTDPVGLSDPDPEGGVQKETEESTEAAAETEDESEQETDTEIETKTETTEAEKESQTEAETDTGESPGDETDLESAYWDSFRLGSTAPQITEKSQSWYADLNHDGIEEQIIFDWAYMAPGSHAYFVVLDQNGTVVFVDYPATAHAGWMTYYLYQEEGKDYLLKYNLWFGTGAADFGCQLLELNEKNEMVQVDIAALKSFSLPDAGNIDRYHEMGWYMDIPAMVEYAETVNGYLSQSYLLFSTDEDWLGEEIRASESGMYITGDQEHPYRQYENFRWYTDSDGPSDEIPDNKWLTAQLKDWCQQYEVKHTENGVDVLPGLSDDEWHDQFMASQKSYEVGSTSPRISRHSYLWSVDLNHDGTMEQLVFDYRFLEIPGTGTFAVLDDQGRVVYSDDIGNSHAGWRSYYLCEREGKQYLLSYDPYMMQNHAGYTYTLMEMNAKDEIVVAESQNLQFKLGDLKYLLYWFPDLVMDIPAMVEFADGFNTLMETSWLLCTTDQDWMGEELYEAGTNYLIGSEINHYRRYEKFIQFTGLSKKSRSADLGRALKEVFDSVSIPYIPPVPAGNT